MSHHFEKAPPLPREPTALNVPAAMRPSAAEPEPLPTAAAPPPPKFPSLTDVGLPSAQAAAAELYQSPAAPAPEPAATQLDSQPSQQQTPFAMPLSPDDIRAAIERDSVTPGTGAKKADEIGHSIWTDQDQETLDRLLKEGQSVYVPPDVVSNDLMVSRASDYIYVPVPAEGLDDFSQDSSVSSRINSWNQVVSKEQDKSASLVPAAAAVGTGAAVTTASLASSAPEQTRAASSAQHRGVSVDIAPAPPADQAHTGIVPAEDDAPQTQQSQPLPSPAVDAQAPEEGTSPRRMEQTATIPDEKVDKAAPVPTQSKSFDASTSIFANNFITVPVKSHVPMSEKEKMKAMSADSQQAGKPTQVKLKDDATAEIKVLKDRGLKGGHDSKVNDAAFMDDTTLITGGDDGKVCIWDLQAEQVRSEFIPYDGQSVTMVYPIPDDDATQPLTLMTFSKQREMRIWTVDSAQAVLLRTTTIQQSDKDLYMSIPFISKDLKARAAAAVAAAAVTTTDTPQEDTPQEDTPQEDTTGSPLDAPPAPSPPEETTPDEDKAYGAQEASGAQEGTEALAGAPESETKEEEKERKRFSLTKVLSFGRSGGRKAVAS